jgi:hypothetical protein
MQEKVRKATTPEQVVKGFMRIVVHDPAAMIKSMRHGCACIVR